MPSRNTTQRAAQPGSPVDQWCSCMPNRLLRAHQNSCSEHKKLQTGMWQSIVANNCPIHRTVKNVVMRHLRSCAATRELHHIMFYERIACLPADKGLVKPSVRGTGHQAHRQWWVDQHGSRCHGELACILLGDHLPKVITIQWFAVFPIYHLFCHLFQTSLAPESSTFPRRHALQAPVGRSLHAATSTPKGLAWYSGRILALNAVLLWTNGSQQRCRRSARSSVP